MIGNYNSYYCILLNSTSSIFLISNQKNCNIHLSFMTLIIFFSCKCVVINCMSKKKSVVIKSRSTGTLYNMHNYILTFDVPCSHGKTTSFPKKQKPWENYYICLICQALIFNNISDHSLSSSIYISEYTASYRS